MAVKKEVSIEAIEKAKKALAGLPGKQPVKKVVEAALEDLKPEIEDLLEKKGYTRQEVVDQLLKQGIPAKLYHIKKLFLTPRVVAGAPQTPAT